MPKNNRGTLVAARDYDRQESALDPVKRLHRIVLSGSSSGVLVTGRSAGELTETRLRVDGHVLPVAVTTTHEKIVQPMCVRPIPEQIARVLKSAVRMIVSLLRPVGADNGSRTDQHSKVGVAGQDGLHQPLTLLFTPDGF